MSLDCTPDRRCHDVDNCTCANLGPVCSQPVYAHGEIQCQQCGWDPEDHGETYSPDFWFVKGPQ
jgi:hypothetical protein